MKTLILVRHGKSSWAHDVKDSERPLKKRAVPDAKKVIDAFKPQFNHTTLLWSSYAERAHETAEMFRVGLEVSPERFEVKDELYTFDADQLMTVINSCEDSEDYLMLFGHNPGITEVANALGNLKFDNVPTTGLVLLEFQSESWKELKKGKTLLYLFPKNL